MRNAHAITCCARVIRMRKSTHLNGITHTFPPRYSIMYCTPYAAVFFSFSPLMILHYLFFGLCTILLFSFPLFPPDDFSSIFLFFHLMIFLLFLCSLHCSALFFTSFFPTDVLCCVTCPSLSSEVTAICIIQHYKYILN